MLDAIIAGAGPAGAIAALRLARAGARVLIVERDAFPRAKLCGDTLNPGAIRALESLGLPVTSMARARPIAGMRISGPGATVEARYRDGIRGIAITRAELDAWLLDEAVKAGARVEHGLTVRAPLVDGRRGRPLVRGLTVARRGAPDDTLRLPASVTIAADGRRSTIARALNLSRHPAQPRRWAFGTYATGIAGLDDLGEMHVRRRFYLGIAPLAGGCANVCLVTSRPRGGRPPQMLADAIASDPMLADRFREARFDDRVTALGPLAVETVAPGADGVLLAGDASGFVDPMTGDGLHLAIRSADLAASAAIGVLEHGDFQAAVARLEAARRETLGAKLRFNRIVRGMTSSPLGVSVGDLTARVAPGIVRWAVSFAGDAA